MSAKYGSTKIGGEEFRLYGRLLQADITNQTSIEFVAPSDGYIRSLQAIANAAIAGGAPVLTVLTGPTGANVVAGINPGFAAGAAKGSRPTTGAATSTQEDIVTTKVAKGDRIQVKPTGAGVTAGDIGVTLHLNSLVSN